MQESNNKRIINKNWDHKENEEKLYQKWESFGYFKPEYLKPQISNLKNNESDLSKDHDANKLTPKKLKASPFVIMMPPPNVTGKLHIGHALFVTLEDIMTRYHRLIGDETLWLPGTDHAGIATQTVVDKALKKEGINRRDLGREKFVEKVWEWKKEYGGIITQQIRRLGASCDWSRERFTFDEGLSKAVNEAFVKLHEKGLIYQGLRVVNWCPRCHTAIADDEVEHRPETGKLYWIKYGPFTLATARPETKLGDTAVAVHPSDKRYKDKVGKKFMIPGVLGEFEIIVVADNAVDPKFGTGAIKVTPAHSFVDYEIAQRHNIGMRQIIDENGRMMENTGKYAGMKTAEAREAIVEDMQKMGLIDHIDENYEHNVAVCYRCGGVIEPIPSKQWFVKMGEMAKRAKKAVEDGEVEIIPKRFEKVYFNWMDNIRDWCISRQLWWGHRIPVWYAKSNIKNQKSKISDKDIYVGLEPPKDAENWVQDEDVLDTWFSSALWPFSTLGWPNVSEQRTANSEKPSDYEKYYPTSVLETGYDILFFWVAKMIMMGQELTGKVPFKTVYLHGLVRDEHNHKMSKSAGNGIDPLEIADKYGADALRMALVVGATPGQDIPVGENKIRGYRNFSNKIWNASRFVCLQVSEGDLQSGEIGAGKINNLDIDEAVLSDADKQILRKHQDTITKVQKYLEKYQFSMAGEELYNYFWHEFCDIYIESAKTQLDENHKSQITNHKQDPNIKSEDNNETMKQYNNETTAVSDSTKKILTKVLSETLIMLHPFVPFVTEAVWQDLREVYPGLSESIMVANWPE